MSELPEGWVHARMGDLCAIVRGVTYKKGEASSAPAAGLVPIVTSTQISDRVLALNTKISFVPMARVSDPQWLRRGDIVVATSSGSASVVGKSAMLPNDWHGSFGAFCSALRPDTSLEPAYIAHYVGSPRIRQLWSALAAGTNINNLKRQHLADTHVPLPPRNEQRRIVAAIEEQFSRLDAADALVVGAIQRIQLLRTLILVAVTRGAAAASWPTVTVGEAGRVDLGRQRSPKYHLGQNMRPYLRVANVFENRIDLTSVMEMDFKPDDYARYRLEPGDILLNEGQSPDLLGRPAMFRGELENACFTNSLLRFRASASVDGEYALLVFRSHLHSGRFRQESRITTNIAHLSAGRFKAVDFPLPSLGQQRHVVDRVHRSLSLIDAVDARLRAVQVRATALRRLILTRAFSGRLVPQDPADEAASALLECIRAERQVPQIHRGSVG